MVFILALFPLSPYKDSKHFCRYGVEHVRSAKLAACHNTRIRRNRLFQGRTQRPPTAMGWFFGCKLHRPINPRGHHGPQDPCSTGQVVGDRGYITKFPMNIAHGRRFSTCSLLF